MPRLPMTTPADCVVVIRADWGETTFSRATADQFEPGVLTITSTDTHATLDTFQPPDWRSVTRWDRDTWPEWMLQNDYRKESQP